MTRMRRRAVLRAGAASLGAAAVTGNAAGQDDGEPRPDFDGYIAEADGGFLDARGQDEVNVDVGAAGNGGNFAFEPAGLWIDPGTTIVWEWTGEGGQHNVVDEDGEFESDLTAEPGFTFEYTFESGGITTYYCQPHKALGMKGGIAVGDDVPTVEPGDGGGDGAESEGYTLPGDAFGKTVVGVIFGFLGLLAVALLGAEGYASYRARSEATAESGAEAQAEGAAADVEPGAVPDYTEEAPEPEPVNEIGHDGYDPNGTATLIVIYLIIIVLMWVFMYFVEFLGNGPTVIG